jgi:hypothetical protein
MTEHSADNPAGDDANAGTFTVDLNGFLIGDGSAVIACGKCAVGHQQGRCQQQYFGHFHADSIREIEAINNDITGKCTPCS